ncbi:MAG: hypothetical protein R3F43_13715 [bacterium]
MAAIAVQNFLLRITPLRAGELSLPGSCASRPGSQRRALVALVLVRLADLAVLLVAAMVAGVAWFGAGERSTLVAALALGAVALLVALWRFRQVVGLLLRMARVAARVARIEHRRPVRKVFARLDEALADGERLTARQWVVVAGGTLVVAALQFILFRGAARRLRQHARPVGSWWARARPDHRGPARDDRGQLRDARAGWIGGFVWVGMPLQEAALPAVAAARHAGVRGALRGAGG